MDNVRVGGHQVPFLQRIYFFTRDHLGRRRCGETCMALRTCSWQRCPWRGFPPTRNDLICCLTCCAPCACVHAALAQDPREDKGAAVRGPWRMCEQEKKHVETLMIGAGHTAAPRGRPYFGYHNVGGEWRHVETGEPFDPQLHAAGVHARKQACMHRKYWLGGGREHRLARYTKKRKPKLQQLTLCAAVPSEADKIYNKKEERRERLPSSHSSPPVTTCSLYLATRPSTFGASFA